MSRTGVRRAAMQLIYAHYLGGGGDSENLLQLLDYSNEEEDFDRVEPLVQEVLLHKAELEEIISSYSQQRALERIPYISRSILLLALYELLYQPLPDTSEAVVISQAVELAKRYALQTDARFINGVLGAFEKDRAHV